MKKSGVNVSIQHPIIVGHDNILILVCKHVYEISMPGKICGEKYLWRDISTSCFRPWHTFKQQGA